MYQQQQNQPSQAPSGGTSKIVPVIVSAGLAVGVFAGLLFGVGTGEVVASSGRRVGSGSAELPSFDVGTEEYEGKDKVALIDAAPPDAPPVDAAPVEPTIKLARLTFTVNPAGTPAKITIDGKAVEGTAEIDVTAGAKNVEVVVKAPGFKDFKKKMSITEDEEQTIDMVKKPVYVPNTGGNNRRNNDKIDI